MEYGYFDDKSREYVITNPMTPMAWKNYSGSDKYRIETTNNAGGCSVSSGRLALEDRYVYIRNDDDREVPWPFRRRSCVILRR